VAALVQADRLEHELAAALARVLHSRGPGLLRTPAPMWNALGLTETGFVGLSSNYTELV
jgi:hypothetical protein